MKLMIPPFLSLIHDFGPDELDPDADEGAEANDDPGDEDPGSDAPNTNMEPDANKDLGTNRYNLRSNRGRSYGHRLDHQMDDPVSSKSYESGGKCYSKQPIRWMSRLTTSTSTFLGIS